MLNSYYGFIGNTKLFELFSLEIGISKTVNSLLNTVFVKGFTTCKLMNILKY